ncbi:MAG: glycoside hydrolase family 3 C-terminal domain-containing protein [Clostridiales Family XIII bacterium]|nr:glycoside hydrolase family 3 C-terminal domain-containing protein [Clostridiales Family XIII bacterium]
MENENVIGKAKMSRKKKIGIIVGSIVAALLIIILLWAFVLTNAGSWFFSRLAPDSEEVKMSFASASETTQVIADEGFVLMQNDDDLLPLSTSADDKLGINIFGTRGVQPIFNAGGSASSDVSNCLRFEDALSGADGNFAVNDELLYYYYNFVKNGTASLSETAAPINLTDSEFLGEYTNRILPELPADKLTDTSVYDDGRSVLDHAYDFSDIAMIVLGRGGGEMSDFTPSELQLQDDEAALVDAVCDKFEKVILVLNSANAIELDFLEDYPSIKSVVWIAYPGEAGNASLARILNGTVNPSGRLTDTWLKDNLASPAANNYLELQADGTWGAESAAGIDMFQRKGNFHYTNAPDGQGYFETYSEGIYVGYKYFETRHDTDSAYNYDDDVMFPFGHGLSYTTFEKDIIEMDEQDGVVTVRVEVKNTGEVPGKDVIEVYYNPPYTGAIEKSTVNLVAFKKTNEIAPGETERYSVEFSVEDMASYDYKTNQSYILEKGDYEIMLRDDSHTLIDSEVWNLSDDIIYSDEQDGKRSTDIQIATNQFDDALGVDDYLTREWDSDARAFTGPLPEDFEASKEILDALTPSAPTDAELGLTESDLPEVGVKLDETILLSDMVDVPYDDSKWDAFISQLTIEELASFSGNGAYKIEKLDRLGVPQTNIPDGPTSITTSIYSGAMMGMEGHGVTYPSPVVVASCWNEDIYYMMGESVGNEAQAIGFTGWYAPAMNTHRTAFNGRNFEYYSEDGVLAGKTSGNVVRGVTDKGLVVFMKHFALNDRENNCRSQLFTWSNEQAIREIYLKPFEAAVKNGGAMGAMSSFNYIGLKWAGANESLLTEVLRNEWGFHGAVVTDAAMGDYMDPVLASYAGGNLSLDMMAAMGLSLTSHTDLLKAAAENPDTKIGMTRNLVRSAKGILYAASRTWQMAG